LRRSTCRLYRSVRFDVEPNGKYKKTARITLQYAASASAGTCITDTVVDTTVHGIKLKYKRPTAQSTHFWRKLLAFSSAVTCAEFMDAYFFKSLAFSHSKNLMPFFV